MWAENLYLGPFEITAFMIRQKNMASRGRGLFSIYICIENFKILLVKYILTDFNNALVILYQECSSNPDLSKKHGCQGVGLIFL